MEDGRMVEYRSMSPQRRMDDVLEQICVPRLGAEVTFCSNFGSDKCMGYLNTARVPCAYRVHLESKRGFGGNSADSFCQARGSINPNG